MEHIKKFKQFNENLSDDNQYELIGTSLDEVLDAVNILKFHYGSDYINVVDESGHESGPNFGVYIKLSPSIEVRSGGEDPNSNIVREFNYHLEQEESNVKIYKIN